MNSERKIALLAQIEAAFDGASRERKDR